APAALLGAHGSAFRAAGAACSEADRSDAVLRASFPAFSLRRSLSRQMRHRNPAGAENTQWQGAVSSPARGARWAEGAQCSLVLLPFSLLRAYGVHLLPLIPQVP